MALLKRKSERGQIMIIVATGMLFVMLGATALAVDWGNGLFQKRRLQNAADAAALAASDELLRTSSVASAVSRAQSIVTSNTGGTVSLSYPATGTGTNLSDGIEVTTPNDVRVALVRQVPTYFAPVLGVNNLTVRVRSRASGGPFGVLPIAVKRFSEGNTAFPLGGGSNPTQVRDYMAPAEDATGQTNYISVWPSPLTTPPSPAASFTPVNSYDPEVSGAVVPIVGRRAIANVANGMDFHFFVAPDVRGITKPVPDFYNGASLSSASAAQLLKDTTLGYILNKGYPGPNPLVEEQLGTFSGAPTDQAVAAMRKTYKRGDVVAAMVYDGTVYRKPAFDLALDSAMKYSSNIGPGGSPLTFQVTLTPKNNFNSSGVQFSATGLEGWGDWQFESGGLNTTYTEPVPGGSDVTLTFSVSASSVVQGARTAIIQAYDTPSGTLRTASATVVVGTVPCFSISSAEAFKSVEQNSATRFDLDLRGWNSYPNTDVNVNPTVQWYTTGANPSPTSPPSGVTLSLPSSVRVRDGQTTGLRVNVDVSPTASMGEWMFQVQVQDPNDSSRNQQIYLTLLVIPASTNPTVSLSTSFVKVLGFANFVITYANNASSPDPNLDNNTIYGYAVSPMVPSPALLGLGARARLVDWIQTR